MASAASSLPGPSPSARNPQWTGAEHQANVGIDARPCIWTARSKLFACRVLKAAEGGAGVEEAARPCREPGKRDKAVDAGARLDEGSDERHADERDLRLRQCRTERPEGGVAQMKSPMREARNRATFRTSERRARAGCVRFTPAYFRSYRARIQGVTVDGRLCR